MKLSARTVAFAAALSVVFWNTFPTLFFMILPTSILQFLLVKLALPLGMFSMMILNMLINFVSTFLVVFTAAYLYNRWAE